MQNIDPASTVLVLISATLVFIMTPGLAFFYGGLVRRKNVLSIMMQSFMSMGVVTIIWVFGGFSLVFGQSIGGLIGDLRYFALNGVGFAPAVVAGVQQHIPFLAFFVFQEMFAVITPALITGAFADRVTFKSYMIFLVFWSILVYLPLAHWTWGGGLFAKMGVVDFAGGIVVHMSAGFAALASVFIVGKRKILPQEKVLPHNITYVALGAGLLWFGWFGFNGGSALSANGLAAIAFVNTDISASLAMIVWLLISWIHEGKPSMTGALTGSVAGLVAITPAAGYVQPWASAVIGVITGFVCYGAIQLRAKWGWDDALDVWACHGVGGTLGTILVGVFAASSVNGVSGLIEGNVHQFGVQLLAALITIVYAFGVTWLIMKFVNLFMPIRVPDEVEIKGLDEGEFGEEAYTL
ncbi:MAG TPA: ammonium transporter [Anaerolineales bacterium]|nr:ammonium transporter [Anaerolineales bacterium]